MQANEGASGVAQRGEHACATAGTVADSAICSLHHTTACDGFSHGGPAFTAPMWRVYRWAASADAAAMRQTAGLIIVVEEEGDGDCDGEVVGGYASTGAVVPVLGVETATEVQAVSPAF